MNALGLMKSGKNTDKKPHKNKTHVFFSKHNLNIGHSPAVITVSIQMLRVFTSTKPGAHYSMIIF